jgi:hypothetical protein
MVEDHECGGLAVTQIEAGAIPPFHPRWHSSNWPERLVVSQEATGSSPVVTATGL